MVIPLKRIFNKVSCSCVKVFAIIILLIISPETFSLNIENVIKKADNLIKEKQYASAFEFLSSMDKENSVPKIQIKKIDLIIKYSLRNYNHIEFYLKNLMPWEKFDEVMKIKNSGEAYAFNGESVLKKCISKNSQNYEIHFSLGLLYFNMYKTSQYAKGINAKKSHLYSIKYLAISAGYGHHSSDSMVMIAQSYLLLKKYNHGIRFLKKYSSFYSKDPRFYYFKGRLFVKLKKYDKAFVSARKAYKYSKNDIQRAEALQLIGHSFMKRKKYRAAYTYFELAKKNRKNDEITSLYSFKAALAMKGNKKTIKAALDYISCAPEYPMIYQNLLKLCVKKNELKVYEVILRKVIMDFKNNTYAVGNAYLHLGYLYMYYIENKDLVVNKRTAKESFMKARREFLKVFSPPHSVYRIIDSRLRKLQSK